MLTVDPSYLTNSDTLNNVSISDNVEFIETEVVKSELSQKQLIKLNDGENLFSPYQPIFIKNEVGIGTKEPKDIVVGDILVNIDSNSGKVSYVPVEKIEILDEGDVYEIRTAPHAWFLVGNYLVIS